MVSYSLFDFLVFSAIAFFNGFFFFGILFCRTSSPYPTQLTLASEYVFYKSSVFVSTSLAAFRLYWYFRNEYQQTVHVPTNYILCCNLSILGQLIRLPQFLILYGICYICFRSSKLLLFSLIFWSNM